MMPLFKAQALVETKAEIERRYGSLLRVEWVGVLTGELVVRLPALEGGVALCRLAVRQQISPLVVVLAGSRSGAVGVPSVIAVEVGRLARQLLNDVVGRLVQAQEEERARLRRFVGADLLANRMAGRMAAASTESGNLGADGEA